jgi:hypothetical protein
MYYVPETLISVYISILHQFHKLFVVNETF